MSAILTKQCQCKGTSSGPRFSNPPIEQKWDAETKQYTFTASSTFSRLVCDVCETAWKPIEEKSGE